MSYIFMKILEKRPGSYDAGIAKYSAGDFGKVREEMLSHVKEGDRVLDVGCGPGTYSVQCAERGASVVAVDVNPQMLYTAELAAKKAAAEDKIDFHQVTATELEPGPGAPAPGLFDPGSFDVIVFSLSMSELREVEQLVAMQSAFDLLKPGGKLIVADEVVPAGIGAKVLYHVRRTLLYAVTRIISGGATQPVREMAEKFGACGFDVEDDKLYEGASLRMVVGKRMEKRPEPQPLSPYGMSITLEMLAEIYGYLALTFRAVPIRTGLYQIGHPTKDSPILVTANFILTFTSLRKHLRGKDCYLLVIDSRGINVWCAAGKGNFSAEEVHNSLRATRIGDLVDTRRLILPKLSGNGVRLRDIKKLSGWDAVFGPVYARDLPEYLSGSLTLTERMKRVRFNLADRLWVAIPFALFVAAGFAIPLLFLPRLYSHMIPLIGLAAGVLFPAAFYILPTDRFFKKAIVLGVVGSIVSAPFLLSAGASVRDIISWTLTIIGITLFVAMDYSGMSPVSNYSKIREEYYVAAPLIGIIMAVVLAMRFFLG